MDTSLKKNQKKKSEPKENDFFPEELRGKKLQDDGWLGESKEPLKKYLMTKKPEFLFQAMKVNLNKVLQGIPEYSIKETEFVGAHTIVWATIDHWQWVYLRNRGNEEIIKEVEKLLMNVGRALIPSDVGVYEEIKCGEFFVHKKPKWKGSDASLRYRYVNEFIDYWNEVEKAFLLKKRYKAGATNPLLEELKLEGNQNIAFATAILATNRGLPKALAILRIIDENLNEQITVEDIARFNYSTKQKTIASYIAWKNEKICHICKEASQKRKKVAYKTILNLYTEAQAKLKKSVLPSFEEVP